MKRYDNVEVTVPHTHASASNDTLGKFSLLTVFLVTVLLIGGMIADRQRVAMAFVCGVMFFTVFGGMVIFILSGQLAAMVVNHQNQRTIRTYNQMQFDLYVREAPEVEVARLSQLEDNLADKMLDKNTPTFVPAVPRVDESLKLSSYDFVLGLFKNGAPDPERILPEGSKRPGQVQAKKPRPEVLEYLLGLGMVRVDEGTRMLFFDVGTYPTLRDCQNSIRSGIPARSSL